MKRFLYFFGLVFLGFLGCKNNPSKPFFETLTATETGIDFSNKLHATAEFNMFHYMYFYNGAGVGAGDFNNDGKIDLFFTANQAANKLYLNQGNLKFEDITDAAKIPADTAWNTGVSVVDINNDGWLDIYICRVGDFEVLKGKNQFLINKGLNEKGIPQFEDQAQLRGLDFSGFSTQAVFFDFDQDGDLDMFLLNHSVHQNGSFAPRANFLGTYSQKSGDKLYINDGTGRFTDATKTAQIHSSTISYGLGVVAADIDLDGWTDLYVGNDFHENDYLYINQKNGTFKETLTEKTMHTSQFSMGVDVADVNNDAFPEIISVDMLPSDPVILKRSLGEDEYDIFNYKIGVGYHPQYARNNLQYNRKNGLFSEVGLYAGVYATDWSWASLWMDFDNDGLKDLFISNGIPKRMNDIDYVNFVSDQTIQDKIRNHQLNEKDLSLVDKFPEIKIPNKFYKNKGNLRFEDLENQIKDNAPTFSNGSVYADLDNDGDLDIVVNNIDEKVLIYKNTHQENRDKSAEKQQNDYARISLKGSPKNLQAIGAKVLLFSNESILTYEKFPVHGFQSSMEIPLHIGLKNLQIDSAFLIWPDNRFQKIDLNNLPNSAVQFNWTEQLPLFDYPVLHRRAENNLPAFKDITEQVKLNYTHKENVFQEFNREFLLPHMNSTEGPALAVADINGDGLEDVFVGAARYGKAAVFLQEKNGSFRPTYQPALTLDSNYEDVDAIWVDINKDNFKDLVIASGGNEFFGEDKHLLPRLFLNDGKGNLQFVENAFANIYVTQSCVRTLDINQDGWMDLFIGGRAVPFEYGKKPRSFLLLNTGKNSFQDVTEQYAKALLYPGMVTNATILDINQDKKSDIVLTQEWGGLTAFIQENNHFVEKNLTQEKGWWNFCLPIDINNDKQVDFIAGNLGLNTRLHASEKEPIRLYFNDFDDNKKAEQIVTYYLNGKEIIFANKDELQKQLPGLKKKYLYAKDFAEANLYDIIDKKKLSEATLWQANYFSNSSLLNKGNLQFELNPLPWEAQLTTYKAAVPVDINQDGWMDVLMVGNFYENNIQMGRQDADYGTMLINTGKNTFQLYSLKGTTLKGQYRKISPIIIQNKQCFILAQNNGELRVIKL